MLLTHYVKHGHKEHRRYRLKRPIVPKKHHIAPEVQKKIDLFRQKCHLLSGRTQIELSRLEHNYFVEIANSKRLQRTEPPPNASIIS